MIGVTPVPIGKKRDLSCFCRLICCVSNVLIMKTKGTEDTASCELSLEGQIDLQQFVSPSN